MTVRITETVPSCLQKVRSIAEKQDVPFGVKWISGFWCCDFAPPSLHRL